MAKSKKSRAFASFERAEPASVGLDPDRLAVLKKALQRDVDENRLPGCVIAIARQGKLAFETAVGYRDAAQKQRMTTDTVFSIASMTKPIVSVAILQLFEQGHLLLGDPLGTHLPELDELQVGELDADGGLTTRLAARQPTIHDLLRHTSGLTYQNRGSTALYAPYPGSSNTAPVKLSKSDMLAELSKCPLLFEPGSKWEYGFSTDVLGFIVEKVTGSRLGTCLKTAITEPLGMSDTQFELTQRDSKNRYARAFEHDSITGEKNWILHADGGKTHWQPGGGGLVSTASDYLTFAQMLLDGGTHGDTRILGRKTVELMTSDHLGPDIENRIADTMDPACDGYGFGLGVAVRHEDGLSASAGTVGDFYWSGVYGTYFWVDPIEEMAVVFLAACPGPARLRLRQLARSLVYQAIAD